MEMSTTEVAVLANKCGTLMASIIHQIPLFTPSFVEKLIKCTSLFVFKIYLLPYMNWFDCSILKQLVIFSNNKKAFKMVNQFVNSLDFSKPITSYDIPQLSELLIPLETNQYTLLVTKHTKSFNKLALSYVVNIKKSLTKGLEITDHAIQLAAIHNKSCCFYWLIPNQIRPLVEDKLKQVKLELWDKGMILTMLLPVNFYSDKNILQWNQSNIFDFFNVNSEDMTEV